MRAKRGCSMTTLSVRMSINGQAVEAAVDSRTLLLDFLRDHAGLTGAKRGCNEGKCGSCTVILGDATVKSCNVLAAQANGSAIQTVEGLGAIGNLHVIQRAFHEHHALQCGFCTAGFLMTTKYLYDNAFPAEPDAIREALHGNICRCTGYQKIVEAVMDVLGNRNNSEQSSPQSESRTE